jgi:hypothetical protein
MADFTGEVGNVSNFYTAGSFWAAVVGTIGTVIVGVISTWYASRAAPKRRLLYSISDPVPLLAPGGLPEGLEVRRGERKLTDPRLVEVTLTSNGRQSISSELFNQGRPMLLDLGVPIVEVLKKTTRPTEQAIPDYRVSLSTLEVGPSAFAPRQQVKFSLLVEGDPELKLVSNLPDVNVRRQQSGLDPKARRTIITGTALTVIAITALVSYIKFTAPTIPAKLIAPNPAAAKAAAKLILPSYGWSSEAQYNCLVKLWDRESGWTYNATNPSGSYGIPQVLPPSKMNTVGKDWLTNAVTQIRWGLNYIRLVYHNPCNAWTLEQKRGYY